MAQLKYTSIKDERILIKTGDDNRSSWRNLLIDADKSMTVVYKGFNFDVNEDTKTITTVDEVAQDSLAVTRRMPKTDKAYVVTPRWTAEQEAIIAKGGTLIIEGVDYLAKDGKKICRCCNDKQDVSNFYNKANQKDKLFPRCKVCDARRLKVAKALKAEATA